jgi:hypothetical protein
MIEPSRPGAVTVAVDFDGVLHQKSVRFSDDVTGDAVPGAAEGLNRLAERYDVVIFTARTALDPVRRWMADHGMGGFEVTHEKPAAEFYIDDHGFRFKSWADVESELLRTSVSTPTSPNGRTP